MLHLLDSEHMGRQLMGILHGLTAQKHLHHIPVVLLPADSPVLQLYNQGRILDDAADNVIGNRQNPAAFTLPPVQGKEPAFQGIPLSVYLLPDHGFPVPFRPGRGILPAGQGPGNLQLAFDHLFQQRLLNQLLPFLYNPGNPAGMELQFLDKFLQIGNKPVLVDDEFHGLQKLLCPPGIEFPEIILIVLVETLKILLETGPPLVDLLAFPTLSSRCLLQVLCHPPKQTGGQIP